MCICKKNVFFLFYEQGEKNNFFQDNLTNF